MGLVKLKDVEPIKHIENMLADVQIGSETTFGNMTMFPLFRGKSGRPDYLTLDEALARGSARVTEVSPEGRVSELKFDNGDDQPVLLVDGEELVGAKQNRVLNLTILAPAHSAFTIPVSCVEAGRWAHTSRQFSSSAQAYFAAGRANKMAQVSESLVTRGVRRSDQQAVWAGIAEKAARFKTASSTGAMYDIFQDHAKRIDDYVTAFTSQDEQVGAAFAINGKIIGVELLDCAPTWQKLLPKLVRSYALDAIDAPAAKRSAVSSAAVKRFLAAIKKAEAKTFPAVGEGVDVRLTAANLRAAGLVANGRVVHLNARSDLNAAQKRASHADEKARNKRNSNLQGEARGSARGREPAAQGLNLPAVALRAWRLTRVMNVNSRC